MGEAAPDERVSCKQGRERKGMEKVLQIGVDNEVRRRLRDEAKSMVARKNPIADVVADVVEDVTGRNRVRSALLVFACRHGFQ